MEDNLDTSPPQSPKKARRRSSFFERRQSMSVLPVIESAVPELPVKKTQETRLPQYIDLLGGEKAAWKVYCSEKKNEYNECFKSLKSNTSYKMSPDALYDALAAEDKEFLEGKPNLKDVWTECSEACIRARDLLCLATRLCGVGARYQEFTHSA